MAETICDRIILSLSRADALGRVFAIVDKWTLADQFTMETLVLLQSDLLEESMKLVEKIRDGALPASAPELRAA